MKLIVTSFVCFFLLQEIHAQEKRIIDWKNFTESIEKTVIIEPVDYGKFTIFQIKNINKFLYKIEMEGKSFELQTPIPTELQTLFRLNQKELEETAETKKAEEGVSKLNQAVAGMQKIATEAKNNKLKALEKGSDKAEEFKKLEKKVTEVIETCKEYLAAFEALSAKIFEAKLARNRLITIAQLDATHDEIGTKLKDVKIPPLSLSSEYHKVKKLYHEVEALYEEAIKLAKDDQEAKEEIEEELEKVEKADELMDEEAFLAILTEIDYLVTELGNEKNFVAVAPPVQMNGDFASYQVKITPSVTRTLGAYRNPILFNFDVPTKGGWKVDFSVGPVISVGKSSKDDNFFLEETPKPDTVTLQKRNNSNSISPGIAAMMHFYKRKGTTFSWGWMLGVGAGFQTTDDVDFSLFTGPTFVLGKHQKIMLSTGISWLRVEKLKGQEFQIGKEYRRTEINLPDVSEKVFRGSLFFSISYNLANRVESN